MAAAPGVCSPRPAYEGGRSRAVAMWTRLYTRHQDGGRARRLFPPIQRTKAAAVEWSPCGRSFTHATKMAAAPVVCSPPVQRTKAAAVERSPCGRGFTHATKMAAAQGVCSPRPAYEGGRSRAVAMSAAGRAPRAGSDSSGKKKRKIVQSEARAIIAKVYHYLKKEFEFMVLHNSPGCDLSHLRNIQQRTADATGASLRTVSRILQEERQLPTPDSKFPSPLKNRAKRANKVDIDKERADIVRATIQEFLVTHNKMPTLKKLKGILQEKIGFTGCLATLQKLLIKLGYKWNKVGNGRKVLVEGTVVEKKTSQKAKSNGGAAWEPAARPLAPAEPAQAPASTASTFNAGQVPVEVVYGDRSEAALAYMN